MKVDICVTTRARLIIFDHAPHLVCVVPVLCLDGYIGKGNE